MIYLIWVAAVVLVGCATPATRTDRLAASHGLQRSEIQGTEFQHVIYLRPGNGPLHVYLEGDGTPFSRPNEVAADPTPRNPLALRLMLADSNRALYLGRPCYHGHASDSACNWTLWTTDRYSERVLASMASALARIIESEHVSEIILIGYSGGGTLAILLAEQISQTRAVITLSANLDTDAWTTLHGYTPLSGSINPARRPALPSTLTQWHLVGQRDTTVPPWITRRGSAHQVASRIIQYAETDHTCCWALHWPAALALIEAALAQPSAK